MLSFVTGLFATDGFIVGTLLPFLFVLLIVVFVHELGHYLVGRWCGIGAKVFSVGFGPELAGFTDRSGTRWRLSWIPLGGYVKFVGDMNAASMPEGQSAETLTPEEQAVAFPNKSVGRRAATVFAGPLANFVFAIAISSQRSFRFTGAAWLIRSFPRSGREASPSASASCRATEFVSLDGIPVEQFSDVQRYVSVRSGEPIEMVMERDGETLTFDVTPERLEIEDRFGNKMEQGIIGVLNDRQTGGHRVEHYGVGESFVMAVTETGYVIKRTGGYIAGIFSGREKPDQIGGPIRVAKMSGQVATLGIRRPAQPCRHIVDFDRIVELVAGADP
jgi:regulator of sigma E protease